MDAPKDFDRETMLNLIVSNLSAMVAMARVVSEIRGALINLTADDKQEAVSRLRKSFEATQELEARIKETLDIVKSLLGALKDEL